MATDTTLEATVARRHDTIAASLAQVRERFRPGGADLDHPRHTRGMVDQLLTDLSRHLNAANAVLLPEAKKRFVDGPEAVDAYLEAAKALEVVVAHVKGHAYGSTYETHFTWDEAWDELETALATQRRAEEELTSRLADTMADAEEAALAARLRSDEAHELTRPHPYAPHTGVSGALVRPVLRRVDAFWDAVEGRMFKQERKHHKRPGLLGRYIMARPEIHDD